MILLLILMSLQMLQLAGKLSARQDGADRAVAVGYESRAVGYKSNAIGSGAWAFR